MIEETIRSLLTSASLASGTRIYPLVAPEGTPAPYIVLFRAGMEARHDLDGPVPLRRNTFQVSVFGSTYSEARADSEAIRTLLDGYSSGVIQACRMTDERMNYEPDTRLFHMMSDFDLDYLA
jgi:hypothetical protein